MGQVSCSYREACGSACSAPNGAAVASSASAGTDETEICPPPSAVTAIGVSTTPVLSSRCCGSNSREHEQKHGNFNCVQFFELARVKFEQGKFVEAEPLFRELIGELELSIDDDHFHSISAIGYLAECLSRQGKQVEAEPLHQKALLLGDQRLGSEHPQTIRSLRQLQSCLCALGKDYDATLKARIEKADRRLNRPSRTRKSFTGKIENPSPQASPQGSPKHLPSHKSFQGNLVTGTTSWASEKPWEATDGERILLITDPGQDNDDEMALLLLGELVRRNDIEVVAVVANLKPANRRAALARGTLDMLDMKDVPVGIGTDGGSATHKDIFSGYISVGMTGCDYFTRHWESVQRLEKVIGTHEEATLSAQLRIYDGQKLLVKVLENAAEKSLTLLLVSSLKDAALLLRNQEQLFVSKVKTVTIMGGMQRSTSAGAGGYVPLEPSDAHNNVFDFESSKFFYRRCQELNVPLVVVSRFTAYGCPVQKKVYDLMVRCPVPHPTVCRLQRAQRASIETLWVNVCAGDRLPARCDKQWFCDTFCAGLGTDRRAQDSMWDLVKTFNMYDPMAVLAAIPKKREQFFAPVEHIGADGKTLHLNIGETKDSYGLKPGKEGDLHDFLMTTWIRAAGRSYHDGEEGEELRPSLLDKEQLTAALTPMKGHTKEESEALNRNVLRLLDEEWGKGKIGVDYDTWRQRDALMRSVGPEMRLVDPNTIYRLGRIPHSEEHQTISMEQADRIAKTANRRFFIEMFSHRWHSCYAPDDRYNNKARVLCEWAKYRESMKLQTFFWIDYACINQSDIGPGVSMLPLYVSCCNNIVCYDTQSYEARAWCRVERLMFSAFVAPNNEYVDPDFEFRADSVTTEKGELKADYDTTEIVPDPSAADAQLSYPSDAGLICSLKDLCTTHWAKCWKDGLMQIVEDKVGLKEVRHLRYGGTQIRQRKFK